MTGLSEQLNPASYADVRAACGENCNRPCLVVTLSRPSASIYNMRSFALVSCGFAGVPKWGVEVE